MSKNYTHKLKLLLINPWKKEVQKRNEFMHQAFFGNQFKGFNLSLARKNGTVKAVVYQYVKIQKGFTNPAKIWQTTIHTQREQTEEKKALV